MRPPAHSISTKQAQSFGGLIPAGNDWPSTPLGGLGLAAGVAATAGGRKRRRVIIYARYSTDEQKPSSIEDQFALCRRWLDREGFKDAEVFELSDEGVSGEVLSRPGIDRARELVRSGEYDLLVAEEISRFFRDRAEPCKLAGECLDNGTRLVAINDDVDTDRHNWQRDISQAAEGHATSNEKTSSRIRRASDGRWGKGQVMGPLPPGYVRVPVEPETYERARRGPFTAEKDEQWAKVISEMFEQVARGDPLWSVAEYLTASGFPLPHNAMTKKWTDRGVKSLVRNPIFKGVEVFGKTRNTKHYGTGHHRPERVDPKEVRSRKMPQLAFVSVALWQQANDAIDKRDRARRHPRGRANPTFRVPRASRSPLSNHFFCGDMRREDDRPGTRRGRLSMRSGRSR